MDEKIIVPLLANLSLFSEGGWGFASALVICATWLAVALLTRRKRGVSP